MTNSAATLQSSKKTWILNLVFMFMATLIVVTGKWAITSNKKSLKRVYSFRLFSRGHFQVINANTKAMHFLDQGYSSKNIDLLEEGISHLETSLGFIRSLRSELEIQSLAHELTQFIPQYKKLIADYEEILEGKFTPRETKIKNALITKLIGLNKHFGFQESKFWKDRAYDFEEVRERNNMISTIYAVVVFAMAVSLFLILYYSHESRKMEEKLESQRVLTVTSSRLAALGQFSASVAHEINNPLTVILWRLKSLRKKFDLVEKDIKLQKEIESIEINSMRIDKIIKGIKTLSKNTESDTFQKVRIESIKEQLEDILSPKIEQLEFDYSFESDFLNLEILAKEVQIIQVMVNLINNSIDAIENLEQKWIKVHAYLDKSQIFFTITDSGNGIDKEIRSQLFELFFTTKLKENKGTGIGLAMATQIIKDHNGTLTYNHKASNTQFIITLPTA